MICAILLSYKRPENISRIVDVLKLVPKISRIVICNNNPNVDIFDWISSDSANSSYIDIYQQESDTDCAYRFQLAFDKYRGFEHFICPDDDIFLDADQYDELIDAYIVSPENVFGVRGQLLLFDKGAPFLYSGVSGENCYLDILNCMYLFSKSHLERYFQLIAELRMSGSDLRFIDDMLISFCSHYAPQCVDVGEILYCDTQDDSDIATWRQSGFMEKRIMKFREMTKLNTYAS